MATKTAQKMECPRCDGSGIYAGFGVCYLCNGRKTITKRAPRKQKPAIVETPEAQEARLRANMGDADYEIVYNGKTLQEVYEMGIGRRP